MARRKAMSAVTRLARLQAHIEELRPVQAGDQGPVVAYAGDPEDEVER